ncbi:hypothetical protein ACOSP7_029266 [Xanthoceras sorbifolium]
MDRQNEQFKLKNESDVPSQGRSSTPNQSTTQTTMRRLEYPSVPSSSAATTQPSSAAPPDRVHVPEIMPIPKRPRLQQHQGQSMVMASNHAQRPQPQQHQGQSIVMASNHAQRPQPQQHQRQSIVRASNYTQRLRPLELNCPCRQSVPLHIYKALCCQSPFRFVPTPRPYPRPPPQNNALVQLQSPTDFQGLPNLRQPSFATPPAIGPVSAPSPQSFSGFSQNPAAFRNPTYLLGLQGRNLPAHPNLSSGVGQLATNVHGERQNLTVNQNSSGSSNSYNTTGRASSQLQSQTDLRGHQRVNQPHLSEQMAGSGQLASNVQEERQNVSDNLNSSAVSDNYNRAPSAPSQLQSRTDLRGHQRMNKLRISRGTAVSGRLASNVQEERKNFSDNLNSSGFSDNYNIAPSAPSQLQSGTDLRGHQRVNRLCVSRGTAGRGRLASNVQEERQNFLDNLNSSGFSDKREASQLQSRTDLRGHQRVNRSQISRRMAGSGQLASNTNVQEERESISANQNSSGASNDVRRNEASEPSGDISPDIMTILPYDTPPDIQALDSDTDILDEVDKSQK